MSNYVPRPNRIDDAAEIGGFVDAMGIATLISAGLDRVPSATTLPIHWSGRAGMGGGTDDADGTDDAGGPDGAGGAAGVIVGHFAKANPQWRGLADGDPVLLVVDGANGYVSPSWYPSKAETGRAVPTWNYSQVQLRGTIVLHHDETTLRTIVSALTDRHEARRPEPWSVEDAPAEWLAGQLRGIVGFTVAVTEVTAKAKWTQSRPAADRAGVLEGMREAGYPAAAQAAQQSELLR